MKSKKSFKLPKGFNSFGLLVARNGQLQNEGLKADFTITRGSVVFREPVGPNESIKLIPTAGYHDIQKPCTA